MSLLPAKYNFSCWEGATFRTTVTVLSEGPGSTPQDLTGYTSTMNIRTAPDTTPVYTLSTTGTGITLGGTAGTIALYISATDTAGFDSWGGPGIYDLTITNTGGNGDVVPVLWGQFRVLGVA